MNTPSGKKPEFLVPGQASLSADDVRVSKSETAYQGFFQVDRLQLSHRLFRGGWSPGLKRELIRRKDAVCVLPYDPWKDVVVLCEQFRVGALGRDYSPWLLELIAGLQEAGETAEEVARRESEEEGGLSLLALEPIASYHPSPGGANELVHLMAACVNAPEQGGLYGLEEEGEDIKTHLVNRRLALDWLRAGEIRNAATLIALQWLALQGEAIRERWLKEHGH